MPTKNTQIELVRFNNGKERGRWFAIILNNENGRKWIKNFKKKNPQCKIKLRYRYSDRRLAYQLAGKNYDTAYEAHDVPAKFVHSLEMYVSKNPLSDKI